MPQLPDVIGYYVKVNTSFTFGGVHFSPQLKYTVPVETYESTLPDGRRFADLCARAQPKLNPESLP